MRIGEIIDKYLKEHEMSQRQFAKKCGMSNGYISMLISNSGSHSDKPITPTLTSLYAIARGLCMTLDQLIEASDDIKVDISLAGNLGFSGIDLYSFDNIMPITRKRLPLLGEIACGEPVFANEDRDSYVEIGTDINADFCLRAHGDSMIGARIHDGDIVFIKSQEIVNNGEIAAVIIDDEATLKRFYYYKEKGVVILKPENPQFKDIVYTKEDLNSIRILGRAVAFQSDVK